MNYLVCSPKPSQNRCPNIWKMFMYERGPSEAPWLHHAAIKPVGPSPPTASCTLQQERKQQYTDWDRISVPIKPLSSSAQCAYSNALKWPRLYFCQALANGWHKLVPAHKAGTIACTGPGAALGLLEHQQMCTREIFTLNHWNLPTTPVEQLFSADEVFTSTGSTTSGWPEVGPCLCYFTL